MYPQAGESVLSFPVYVIVGFHDMEIILRTKNHIIKSPLYHHVQEPQDKELSHGV